jgi:hypothetical protein
MLGHRFAAEAARDRANGCTNDGAYWSGGDRAGRRTGSDTACRCSKSDSNRVRTRGASNRVAIRPSLFRVVIVHSVLRCTVEHDALSVTGLAVAMDAWPNPLQLPCAALATMSVRWGT